MRLIRTLVSSAVAVAVVGAGIATAPAASAGTKKGQTPLAAVLTADGDHFDKNAKDYDIVTEAVLAVLKAKPKSAVGVLADGSVPLTAFIPNDRAFKLLVKDLTGKSYKSEKKTFAAVAGLGIDTVETVLLYHVVPGKTITAVDALKSNGAKLTTAQGGTITVHVCLLPPAVKLVDADKDDKDPKVVQLDINKGNKQIAHGIDRVLRPINL